MRWGPTTPARKQKLTMVSNYLLLMEEILHRIGSLSHDLQDFIHPKWLAGFLASTVVWYNLPINSP